ncbi:MAG: helicase-related protein [Erysipelotrichaceae bacterium]|nr:helicase-related protein [Erysipelotrichaceae bacterium]
MRCRRCNNTDIKYFYKGSKGYYCRKCVGFKRLLIDEEIIGCEYSSLINDYDYQLGFELSIDQKRVSDELCRYLVKKRNVLLHCICGAGKTEIVLAAIKQYLSQGLRVGYAISRKEVVIELAKRFNYYFSKARVVYVCENHTEELFGDLIVCTTHQLYRYYQYFDLLILDEPDAFPFKNNDVLAGIAKNSVKGQIIYSTATVDEGLLKMMDQDIVELKLLVRPHYRPLIKPKIIVAFKYLRYLIMWYLVIYKLKKTLVFVASKKDAYRLFRIFRHLLKCNYITSESLAKEKIINDFKNDKFHVLFTTTILERGVTFEGVDVIVMDADTYVYDEATLTQCSGRVGRSFNHPDGCVYYLSSFITKEMLDSIREIKLANKYLSLNYEYYQ